MTEGTPKAPDHGSMSTGSRIFCSTRIFTTPSLSGAEQSAHQIHGYEEDTKERAGFSLSTIALWVYFRYDLPQRYPIKGFQSVCLRGIGQSWEAIQTAYEILA